MLERRFVLEPLQEIAPGRIHPPSAMRISDLWRRSRGDSDARPAAGGSGEGGSGGRSREGAH
jgi:7,8-dihydro-6-hydroxymethylpterin-pyrophosphokinase